MSIMVRVPGGDASGRELTLTAPMKEFAAAFDGKPMDPKALEQQRAQLQQQLQKKAEEQRKLLEQQQQSSGAAQGARPRLPLPRRLPQPRRSSNVRSGRSNRRLISSLRRRLTPAIPQEGAKGRSGRTPRRVAAQLASVLTRTRYRPSDVRSKISLTWGWRTGSPDSSGRRFCSDT